MRFSEAFGIVRNGQDDWFDVLLHTDTDLFPDPFLIYSEREHPTWDGAHEELISFFNMALELVARSAGDPISAHWQAASRLLIFPEPSEFCLGFGVGSTSGSGTGSGIGRGMLARCVDAIHRGIHEIEHVEELLLLETGVGADRLGDIVCNVLRARFIRYTQDVARRHEIDMQEFLVERSSWSEADRRWKATRVPLPRNPISGGPVLLSPSRFLRQLPVMSPEDFFEWGASNQNDAIRGEFNYDVARRLRKEDIVSLARSHPDFIRRWARAREATTARPYDTERDPEHLASWYDHGGEIAASHPLDLVDAKADEFESIVRSIVGHFQHWVEQQDGWRVLWASGRPCKEWVIQSLFRSTVYHYCIANDIDITGEANAGRGPVDFKFSRGWAARAVVEVKPTNNTRFWHGLTEQLPQYITSEKAELGFFLAIGFRPIDFTPARKAAVQEAAANASAKGRFRVEPIWIDAREKRSASRR